MSDASPPRTLVFSYLVRPDDRASGIALGGKDQGLVQPQSITDHVGNRAGLRWNIFNSKVFLGWSIGAGHRPRITHADVTSAPLHGDAYHAHEAVEITLSADAPMLVDSSNGGPYLLLTGGANSVPLAYHRVLTGIAGPGKLVFKGILPEGLNGPLFLHRNGAGVIKNAASVTDWEGRQVDQPDPEALALGLKVKTAPQTRPRTVHAEFLNAPRDGLICRSGERVEILLKSNQPLTVSPFREPYLHIKAGAAYHRARYDRTSTGESGSNLMVFSWTVPQRLPTNGPLAVASTALRDAGGVTNITGDQMVPHLPDVLQRGPRRAVAAGP